MARRSSFSDPATIDVQGVLGKFKVPHANLKVEYVLTYASLDGGKTANGQLLDLLVPVREVFNLEDLDFDHLLQRDLDDFRVSAEMVPYLLGETSSDPRFFPPIVAIIVPMSGEKMNEFYPQCSKTDDEDQGVPLKVFNYGNVFSVKRELRDDQDDQDDQDDPDDQLAQSPVDLCIHPTQAKLVIVDGQHRAMAMLAAYRSAYNKWNGNEFQHFYQGIDLDISELRQIHLPVCIAYFPELTQDIATTQVENLTTACRKFFLDVNRNARQPSEARQILLDDTDLVACFTRHLFNMVQKNTKHGTLQLRHTEYDNPHDRISINRPFALTSVYTIYNIIRSVLLINDNRVRNPLASYSSSGRSSQNNPHFRNQLRLRRELDLENILTEEHKDQLGIQIADIKQLGYPRQGEQIFRQCFEEIWGQAIVTALSKLYPFSIHIEAVGTIIDAHKPYLGETRIARTALVEGQGLRDTLNKQRQRDKDRRQNGKKSYAEKAWEALEQIEKDFEKHRAKLYLKLNSDPDDEDINRINRLFDCFCSSAFQNGLFMAFACLKDRMGIDDKQEFLKYVDKWINRINRRFQNSKGARTILFDYFTQKSLRYIYKPKGGLTPSDGHFFRYLILELLSIQTKGKERKIIDEAKTGWRQKLYKELYLRKKQELGSEEGEEGNGNDRLDSLSFGEIVDAFKNSLEIDEEDIELDLQPVRNRTPQSESADDGEETDETEDFEEP